MTLESLRRQLLAARDERAAAIARLAAALPAGHSLVFLSLNVPGADKTSPRLDLLFDRARAALVGAPRHASDSTGRDALGPWAAWMCAGRPEDVKRNCVALEEGAPAGRLLDIDVFGGDGQPIDRRSLELPPRRCLVCRETAVDCIRAARHDREQLAAAVARLLDADECLHVGEALTAGARSELRLTPKPGLVDRRDNGSHPDLSFELMSRSIDLLPEYYDELLHCATDLHACVEAGKRAERRMLDTIGTNAHRGYIFLSGLVLLGFADYRRNAFLWPTDTRLKPRATTSTESLRRAIADVARRVLALRPAPNGTHGAEARASHGVGGIHAEALAGLPSVFEHGLPALDRALRRFGATDTAHHHLMAELMTKVEDTTTLHRCGAKGLARLRADGRQIRQAIEESGDYLVLLRGLNDEYRALALTMGGVADCMAITIAVREIDQRSVRRSFTG